jgi:acetoin utilization deacetylase AcuC-like enzyme
VDQLIERAWPLAEHYEYSAEIGMIIRSIAPGWWSEFEKQDALAEALSTQAAGFRFLEFLEANIETEEDFQILKEMTEQAFAKAASRLKVELIATNNFLDNDLKRFKDQPEKSWNNNFLKTNRVMVFSAKKEILNLTSRPELVEFGEKITKNYQKIETESLEIKNLYKTHSKFYLDGLSQLVNNFNGVWLTPATFIDQYSLKSSLSSAGTIYYSAEKLLKEFEETREKNLGLCLVSSWSHHAERSRALGGCVINNLAVASNMILNNYKLRAKRIAILDIDAHHGNGNQEIFYKEDRVLTISIHQKGPFFPGTGSEIHRGEGIGLNKNINLEVENNWLKKASEAVNHLKRFHPEIIFIELSGDAHKDDPISSLQATDEDYFKLGEMISQINCPVVAEIGAASNFYSLASAVSSFSEGFSSSIKEAP